MGGISKINAPLIQKRGAKKRKQSSHQESSEALLLAKDLTSRLNDFLESPDFERRRGDRRHGVFYASNLGNECERFLWLHYNGHLPEEFIDARKKRIFDHGHSAESRYLKYFQKMRILRGAEVNARWPDPNIHGRVDFILQLGTKVLLELKTINDKGFLQLDGPKREHEVQLQVYLNILGVDHGVVWYEGKNDQKTKAFGITRDPVLWEEILDRCVRISQMGELPSPSVIPAQHSQWCPCIKFEENFGVFNGVEVKGE
jgi:hypothetical protein